MLYLVEVILLLPNDDAKFFTVDLIMLIHLLLPNGDVKLFNCDA